MDSEEPTTDLVIFDAHGRPLDAIVFDRPSDAKAVIAIVDPKRGPILRTVDAAQLTEREAEAPADKALRLLIRRTPPPARGAARGTSGTGSGRAGHARASMHRTTGK